MDVEKKTTLVGVVCSNLIARYPDFVPVWRGFG